MSEPTPREQDDRDDEQAGQADVPEPVDQVVQPDVRAEAEAESGSEAEGEPEGETLAENASEQGATAAQEPAPPPPFPTWRDHFEAAVIWPAGRESAPRQAVRIPLDPVHAHEDRATVKQGNPAMDSVGDAIGAAAGAAGAAVGQAARLAREVAEMSEEERAAHMQRLAAGMRPISSDAERLVVRALDFGATGLSRLADRIERRARTASGLPPANRRK